MKKRARKSLTWLGVVLLVLAGTLIIFTVTSSRSMDRTRAALEAEGRPMSLDELMPEPIPDHQNAAPVYDAAVRQLQDEPTDEGDLFSQLADAAAKVVSENPDPDGLDAFRKLYQEDAVAAALAAIEEGSLRPGYRRDLDLSKGFAVELDHIQTLWKLARILAATARLQAADGDRAAAWDTALTHLRLANALEEEPILVSQLVRIATMRLAVQTIQQLDLTSGPMPAPAAEAAELLRRFEDPAPMVAAIDTERIWVGEFMHSSSWSEMAEASGNDDFGMKGMMFLYQVVPPLRYHDQSTHMTIMAEHARHLGEPYSPDEDPQLDDQLAGTIPAHCFITRLCTPAIGGIKPRMTEMFADARVTRAGLAVIEHRNRTGSYPADLQSLGLDDATDPFTGEPLVYRPEASGFTLYSLGRDVVDDHGTPLDDDRQGDIVWQYSED
jgi:hypothetical protein